VAAESTGTLYVAKTDGGILSAGRCALLVVGMYLMLSQGGPRRRRYAASSTAASSADSDAVPAELTGAVKWTTVKISDDTQPTTDSIFLGADQVWIC